jgi:hypothetical protein
MSLPPTPSLVAALQDFYGQLTDASMSARRVGWESEAAHMLRLQTVVELLSPVATLPTLLDAGCGEGRLLPSLRAAGFRGAYRGEDLLPQPVARARALSGALPDDGAVFEVADALAGGPAAAVVVCAGALNTRVDRALRQGDDGPDSGHEGYVLAALDALLARAEEALVVSLAIVDRHPPGVGIGRVRLGVVLDHLRARRPVVTVHEDGPPGEAVFVASTHRRRALLRRLPDATARAEVLLAAGDPRGALEALSVQGAPTALRGRALAPLGLMDEAEALLAPLCAGGAVNPEAALALAEVRWRRGERGEAVSLLRRAAAQTDEGRAHLAHALLALGRKREAADVVRAIEDAWMRRELTRRLTPS